MSAPTKPPSAPLVVLHAREIWLQRTETWLAGLVAHLPEHVVSHVACRERMNETEFPCQRLECQNDAPVMSYRLGTGVRSWWSSSRTAHLRWVMRRVRPAILHSHFAFEGWENRNAVRSEGVAHVVSCYGLDVSRLPARDPVWRRRYRSLFRDVELVLCEGPCMAAKVVALGCDKGRVVVHALGVDVDRIAFRAPQWTASRPVRILVAASFREKKGIPHAIEAAGVLGRKYPVEVTVIGDASSDPASQLEKRRIEAAASSSGLGSKLRFLGYQSHQAMFDEATRHDVFLAPSLTASDGDDEGGAPVGVIEMAAAGLVVVSTRHCDIPGIIADRRTGLLTEERDVPGLVACLEWLVADPDRWQPLATAARAHVEQNFNAETQGRRLAAIYQSVAASRRVTSRLHVQTAS